MQCSVSSLVNLVHNNVPSPPAKPPRRRLAGTDQLYTISAFDAEGGGGDGTKAWAIFCGLISSVVSGLLAFLQVGVRGVGGVWRHAGTVVHALSLGARAGAGGRSKGRGIRVRGCKRKAGSFCVKNRKPLGDTRKSTPASTTATVKATLHALHSDN